MKRGVPYGKIMWVVLGLILVTLVAQSRIPVGGVAAPREAYENLKIFTDVLAIVQRDYVEPVNSKDLVYGAIKGMLDSLDPHSAFMTPEVFKEVQAETKGEFGGLGIEITMRDGVLTVVAPFEDTPAWKAGIKPDDQIVKIEGKPTKGMTLVDAVRLLRGPKGTKVTISIMRKGFIAPQDMTMVRDIIQVQSVKSRLLEGQIGYIRISGFQERTSRELKRHLKDLEEKGGLKGLVLDLRNNPGGLLDQAVEVADEFIDSGLIVYTEGRKPESKMRYNARRDPQRHDYPMVVLVNGGSASASEIVAGALQDHKRAVILGTRTFGKASVQTITPLEDGSGLRLTTARYFTPLGRAIHGSGINPDIVVMEREEEIKPEAKPQEDIQLNRAVELIKSWDIFQRAQGKTS